MDFKDNYPDYVAIEEHIRRARVERSLALAQFLANAIDATWRGMGKLFARVRSARMERPWRAASPSFRSSRHAS